MTEGMKESEQGEQCGQTAGVESLQDPRVNNNLQTIIKPLFL